MFCLDTDIIIGLLRGQPKIVEAVKELYKHELYTTPITLCELYKGAYLSSKTKKELPIVQEIIETLTLATFNNKACHLFGQEYARLHKKGAMTQQADLMIACIAQAHNLVMVTGNKKHFAQLNVQTRFI